MKRFISISLIAIMALSLAACGNSKGNMSSTSSTTSSKTGTIRVLLSEEPAAGDAFKTVLDTWSRETGNKVDLVIIPYDTQLTKFPAMAKAGDVPDLVATTRLHQLYPNDFVNLGKVVDTSIFNEKALKLVGAAYRSDEITGLPYQYTVTNMYYNKTLFDKAGIKAPTTPDQQWTWDQFITNVKAIQKKTGVKYGFACDYSRARYDTIMYQFGGSLVQKAGNTFEITADSKANVDALTMFVKLNNDGTMPKAIWAGATTDNPADYFANGNVAVLLSGSWNYSKFKNEIKSFEWGAMVTPKEVSSAAIIGGAALAVPKEAKNKDLAIDFLKWFFEKKNYQIFINIDKGPSALKAVQYEPDNDFDKVNLPIIYNEVNYVTDSFLTDENSGWRIYLDNEYRDDLTQAVNGSMTPKQALDDFANRLSQKSGWKIAK